MGGSFGRITSLLTELHFVSQQESQGLKVAHAVSLEEVA